jgi:outer membrane immunogenic protein
MKLSLLRLALLSTVMLPGVSAVAADLDPPPPPDLRPGYYDGFYAGVVGSATSIDGHYDKVPDCVPGVPGCGPVDPEMSGTGFMGGVVAGFNYQMDSFLLGIETDYMWGGQIADNDEPAELTYYNMNGLGTVRARAGFVYDAALIYVTGGYAYANTEFGGEVGPAGAGTDSSDTAWLSGWTIGGGMEYAFTDFLHGRMEYLYTALEDGDFRLEDNNGFGGDVTMHTNGIHQIRAGITYNFSL